MRVGPYEVLREIGRGSMGAVFLARRDGVERPFALKAMNREILADPAAVARFRQEARLASRIEHRGVAAVVDAGEVEGVPYYVMTFCPGETLRAMLRRGPLAPLEAARLARELADAIAAAHAAGCIHRDLKPDNVIMDRETGEPRITDFGLARDAMASTRLTRTGELIGTPYYMSPEQVRGQKDVDGRVDVYSLGVVLYVCLSGTTPFEAKTSAEAFQLVLDGRARPLRSVSRGVPGALVAIVERAMAWDRERRFQSAAELRAALDEFLADAARPKGASRLLLWVLAGTAVLVLGTTALVVSLVVRERAKAEEARRAQAEGAERLQEQLEAQKRADLERLARETAERRRIEEEERKRDECPDLNGRWVGGGPKGDEIIEIKHDGDNVIAYKITGNEAVPAGSVTFRGTLHGKTADCEMQLAERGHKNVRWAKGQLFVVDADTVEWQYAGARHRSVMVRQK